MVGFASLLIMIKSSATFNRFETKSDSKAICCWAVFKLVFGTPYLRPESASLITFNLPQILHERYIQMADTSSGREKRPRSSLPSYTPRKPGGLGAKMYLSAGGYDRNPSHGPGDLTIQWRNSIEPYSSYGGAGADLDRSVSLL